MCNDPEHYYPNLWARILGRANETDVEINGIITKVLIDSGVMILMMSREYYDEHGYEIQPLEHLVPIEGSGGEDVPYLGYVEVRMCIPGINSFDRDVLMLVSPITTHYHHRVPIQVGSCIIDQVTNCISENELQYLSQSWKVAYVSTIISTPVSDLEFDLDQVKGKVLTCEEVRVPTLQTVVIKGLTMIIGHQRHVHVLVELSPKCPNVFILGNTSQLRPRRSNVTVILRNMSGRDITLKPCTELRTVTEANLVPLIQVSNGSDLDEKERVSCMSAQLGSAELPRRFCQQSGDTEGIFQKLDLSWIDEWEPQLQQEAKNLIHELYLHFPPK